MANIVLVGMMGSGKSTIAKVLADRFQLTMVDTDSQIEAAAGLTIPEIFKTKGESHFRMLETSYLSDFSGSNLVLSTGGGMVKTHENRRKLQAIGYVVYLMGSHKTLLSRLKDQTEHRPLLDLESLSKQLEILLAERADMYMDAAHSVVQIDGKTVEAICDEISAILSELGYNFSR